MAKLGKGACFIISNMLLGHKVTKSYMHERLPKVAAKNLLENQRKLHFPGSHFQNVLRDNALGPPGWLAHLEQEP